ncbi:MAG: hypothetical protein KGH94_00170 [Candidatus Micrarchaeota archaeon]|nr:hypothetical protein [Candidatus Micrarchaeota archaeon]
MAHAEINLSGSVRRMLEESMTKELGHAPNEDQLANKVDQLRRQNVQLTPSGLGVYLASLRTGRMVSGANQAQSRARLRS